MKKLKGQDQKAKGTRSKKLKGQDQKTKETRLNR